MLTKEETIALYRKRAKNYDLTARLYYLLGFRLASYRQRAVTALMLRPGDSVVDIACGTGANFPLLQQVIGPKGKIIGVDLTDAMLTQAHQRVKEGGWLNVEIVQSDVASYEFPTHLNGIISSFAITLVPEFDAAIRNGRKSLSAGGGFVMLDFKLPSGLLSTLAPLGAFITHPFGVSMDLASRHPWESLAVHFASSDVTELYAGFVYVAVGKQ
ncbi:MAG: class I SAM-dependent methyltransferase [Candidatus Acidiferrales bacterium]